MTGQALEENSMESVLSRDMETVGDSGLSPLCRSAWLTEASVRSINMLKWRQQSPNTLAHDLQKLGY